MIRVATVLLVALLIVQSVVAQTPGPDRQPIRVRITGVDRYEMRVCQPDERVEGPCWRFFQTLMFVGAPVIGALLGWYIGRVKWERITIDELRGEFATCGVHELYDQVRNSTAQSLRPLWAW